MQEPSIFTKIHNHEIPGEIIFEDEQCFVILTIEPLNPGHVLVIPNEQIDKLWDVNDDTYHHLMDIAKKMAGVIDHAYDYKRVGMVVDGFGVPHAHVHVFGLHEDLNPTIVRHAATRHVVSAEELKIEADKLRACL